MWNTPVVVVVDLGESSILASSRNLILFLRSLIRYWELL